MKDFVDVEIITPLYVRYTLLPTELRQQVAYSRPKQWQGLALK